jgi:predicted amidohydrolase
MGKHTWFSMKDTTDMKIRGGIWQFPISLNISSNLSAILRGLQTAEAESLLVMPEGAISGYTSEPDLVSRLDPAEINRAIDIVLAEVKRRKVHLLIGTCLNDGEAWRNSSLYMRPDGEMGRYDKLNLAVSERKSFKPGDRVSVFPTRIGSQEVIIGVQMCREIRHPEQWAAVAQKGASIFAFLNNAVGDQSIWPIWRSHLISRAAETQRFVLAANNAADDQKCPSTVIAPNGCVIHEVPAGPEAGHICDLDIDAVSDWVLSQRRTDLFSAS